jgi:hypothetical protein
MPSMPFTELSFSHAQRRGLWTWRIEDWVACASCKKIRDDKGSWVEMGKYITQHSEAVFSHGVCDECAKKLYPSYFHADK